MTLSNENNHCLFCRSDGPFSTAEHIIPESLGNDELLLNGEVCDKCQNYFGKDVEKYMLAKTMFAFWRTFLGIKTEDCSFPSVDLSQPKKESGVYPATHPEHDDVGFSFHDDGSVSVDIDNHEIVRDIINGSRDCFQIAMSPKMLFMMGRFLCKVGIELLCATDPEGARSDSFEAARNYARYGQLPQLEGFGQGKPSRELWSLLYYSKGKPSDFRRMLDESGLEEVDCYFYSLFCHGGEYVLFEFGMGTDRFVVSLNRPFPHPIIREAFPGVKLDLMWYSSTQWRKKNL